MKLVLRKPDDFDKSLVAGLVGMLVIGTPAHELGHFITAKILGYNPQFGRPSPLEVGVKLNTNPPPLEDVVITGAGAASEYTVAFSLGILSNHIKNRLLRYSAKMTSTFIGLSPFVYNLLSPYGDYQRLEANGIGREITLPLTLGMALLNAYVAWRKK